MKKGWKTEPLGELCDIRNGSTPSKGNAAFWDGGTIPWFTIDDMREQGREISSTRQKITKSALSETSVKLLPEDSVLLCCTASVGEFAITRIPLTTNQQFNGLVVKNRNQLDPNFLFHYASTLKDELLGLSGKTTIDFIPISRLRDVAVPLPPLAEQQRIVGLLDEAFEGLATAKANAEKNLQNARALFESHLQSVFTQRGEGWVKKRLNDVCSITSSLVDPRKDEFLDLTHVGAGNIESQTGVFVELKTARDECLISGKFLFDESMVLYSKIRPYLMKVARPDFNGLCSADMYPLAPWTNEITRDYLFHLLLSKPFTDYAIQGSARAGMPKVNREHLFGFRVWLPSVERQKKLAAKLDALHEETHRLAFLYQRKHAALEALKKSLLHQAFTGEL